MIHFNNIVLSTYSDIIRSKPYINSQLFHRPSFTRDNYKTQGTADFPSQKKQKMRTSFVFVTIIHLTYPVTHWIGQDDFRCFISVL